MARFKKSQLKPNQPGPKFRTASHFLYGKFNKKEPSLKLAFRPRPVRITQHRGK